MYAKQSMILNFAIKGMLVVCLIQFFQVLKSIPITLPSEQSASDSMLCDRCIGQRGALNCIGGEILQRVVSENAN